MDTIEISYRKHYSHPVPGKGTVVQYAATALGVTAYGDYLPGDEQARQDARGRLVLMLLERFAHLTPEQASKAVKADISVIRATAESGNRRYMTILAILRAA